MVFCQRATLTEGDLETRLRLCLFANNEMYGEIVYYSLLCVYLATAQGHLALPGQRDDHRAPFDQPNKGTKISNRKSITYAQTLDIYW